MEALERTAPHGRDYYPQGDEALGAARKEFRTRLQRVTDIRDELLTIAEGIPAQLHERDKDRY